MDNSRFLAKYLLSSAIGLLILGCADGTAPSSKDSAPSIDTPDAAVQHVPGPIVRFVALGDAGTGGPAQKRVAQGIQAVCEEHGGCDFVLYLGGNFYQQHHDGLTTMEGPLPAGEGPIYPSFPLQFEDPYMGLDMPFLVVAGVPDWSIENDALVDRWVGMQLEYATTTDKWVQPGLFHIHNQQHVDFIGLDTTALQYLENPDSLSTIEDSLTDTKAVWRIGFGYHNYLSNGNHSNASSAAGHNNDPAKKGRVWKDYFETHLCPTLDVYIGANDHNRQWLTEECGVMHVVSGAGGAYLRALPTNKLHNPSHFQEDQHHGFVFIEIDGNELRGTFYRVHDAEGNYQLSADYMHPPVRK